MALYYGPLYQDSEYDATSDSEEDITGWKPPKNVRRKKIRKPTHHPLFESFSCENNEDSVVSIHMLNNDCLNEIFLYLHMIEKLRMSMVCKRWYNLSVSLISSLTELTTAPDEYNLDYFNFDLPRANHILCTLALIGENLTKLQLSKVKRLDKRYLTMIARCCPNIDTLCCDFLIGRSISDVLADEFAEKLKHLTIPSSRVGKGKYLGKILEKATKLETLNLSALGDGSNVEGDVLIISIAHCSSLRAINLCSCSSLVTLPCQSNILEGILEELPGYDKCFRSYYLRAMGISCLRVKVIEFILANFTDTLEVLNLSDIVNVVCNFLPEDEKKCGRMRELYLRGKLPKREDEPGLPLEATYESKDLLAVLNLVPTLRVLDITANCDMKTNPLLIAEICDRTPVLEELILTDCRLVVENLLSLRQLKYLKKLCLGHELFPASRCDEAEFDYQCFSHTLLPTLTSLEVLSVNGAESISDEVAVSLIKNAPFSLAKLGLVNVLPTSRRSLTSWQNIFDECKNFKRNGILRLYTEHGSNHAIHQHSLPEFLQLNPKDVQLVDFQRSFFGWPFNQHVNEQREKYM